MKPNICGKKAATDSPAVSNPNFSDTTKNKVSFGSFRIVRTDMNSQEQKKYSNIVSALPPQQRGQMDNLLKRGVLLDSRSNDNTTVLDNSLGR